MKEIFIIPELGIGLIVKMKSSKKKKQEVKKAESKIQAIYQDILSDKGGKNGKSAMEQ